MTDAERELTTALAILKDQVAQRFAKAKRSSYMTKAERDLLLAVAAAVGGWGMMISDNERQELCELAGVTKGDDIGVVVLKKMRSVAKEESE